eukprot:14512726-Alexandrium_andersonii.AAC.1
MCIRDSACQGPPAGADCVPAGAEVGCKLYQVPLRHCAQSSALHEPVSYTHLRAHETSAHL